MRVKRLSLHQHGRLSSHWHKNLHFVLKSINQCLFLSGSKRQRELWGRTQEEFQETTRSWHRAASPRINYRCNACTFMPWIPSLTCPPPNPQNPHPIPHTSTQSWLTVCVCLWEFSSAQCAVCSFYRGVSHLDKWAGSAGESGTDLELPLPHRNDWAVFVLRGVWTALLLQRGEWGRNFGKWLLGWDDDAKWCRWTNCTVHIMWKVPREAYF